MMRHFLSIFVAGFLCFTHSLSLWGMNNNNENKLSEKIAQRIEQKKQEKKEKLQQCLAEKKRKREQKRQELYENSKNLMADILTEEQEELMQAIDNQDIAAMELMLTKYKVDSNFATDDFYPKISTIAYHKRDDKKPHQCTLKSQI